MSAGARELLSSNRRPPNLDQLCWICHLSPEEDDGQAWVAPCKCSGSTKWVHHDCLLRWLAESSHYNTMASGELRTKCSQCKTPYRISEPKPGIVVALGARISKIVEVVVPYAGVGLLLSGIWTSLACYSAGTIVFICGRQGKTLLYRTHPLLLFLTLPMIPLTLVTLRVKVQVRRQGNNRLPRVVEGENEADNNEEEGDQVQGRERVQHEIHLQLEQNMKPSRIVVGALLLPYVSTGFGWLLTRIIGWTDEDVHPLDRAIYGGAFYVALKSFFKRIYKKKSSELMQKRRILDYDDDQENLTINF
eukprot:m.194007 g.194007  ORF g.194007 m.194007 type:complete len:305 (+) comp15671_c0_seq5:173-1087(+)